MISPLHPRVAALFFKPKRNQEDQLDDHQRRYQQHGMCNNGQHQSDLQSPHHNTTPFIRGWAVTNSRANILFRLPLGTFYRGAFLALVLRRAPKVSGLTNCCRCQISGLCIDNCDRKKAHVQLTGDNKKAFLTFFNEAICAVTTELTRANPSSCNATLPPRPPPHPPVVV